MISGYYSLEAASPDFDCIITAPYNAEESAGIVLCCIAPSPLMSLKIVEWNIRIKKQQAGAAKLWIEMSYRGQYALQLAGFLTETTAVGLPC